jgi:serine/threonine-protein kinase
MSARPTRDDFEAVWSTLALERTAGIPLDATLTPEAAAALRGRSPETYGAPTRRRPLPPLSFAIDHAMADGDRDLETKGILGEGGMGRVLRARQHSLGRDVAVKVARTSVSGAQDASAVAALLHEASIAGSLEHAVIVPLHALGTDASGQPAIVMKRVEGVPWRDLIRDVAHPAWSDLRRTDDDPLEFHLAVFLRVCDAIEFAHAHGVVHRDIKPENVMVGRFGEVHLLDWGIALRIDDAAPSEVSHALVGTPAYMAPEMLTGPPSAIGPRTDVYLLGATLHEALTASPRHAGATLHDVLASVYESAPYSYPNQVPAELAAICNRATAREAEGRHATAAELRRAVVEYRKHRGSIALATAASERLATLRSRIAAGDLGAEASRLANECRFGFMQALREWDENEIARVGHRDCVIATVDLELARGNAAGARIALQESADAPAPLVARVEAAEAAARSIQERAARADRIEGEFDLSRAAAPRIAVVFAFAALMLVNLFVQSRLPKPAPADPATWAILPPFVLPWCALAPTLYMVRKRLFATVINRRLVGVLLMTAAATLVHRVFAISAGTPVMTVYWTDLVIAAGVCAMGAAMVLGILWWIVPILLAGALAIPRAPNLTRTIFGFTLLAAALAASVGVWLQRRRSAVLP